MIHKIIEQVNFSDDAISISPKIYMTKWKSGIEQFKELIANPVIVWEKIPVFFAESEWMLKIARESYPLLTFHDTSDFKVD